MALTTRRNSIDNALLGEHIAQTFPTNEEGYLGREHFWAMGDRDGFITRAVAGAAHTEICFPIKHRTRRDPPSARYSAAKYAPVDPAIAGLDVQTRYAVGLAYPPVTVRNYGGSRRLLVHLDNPWDTQPVADRVVRAGSLIVYMTNLEVAGKILHSNSALAALSAFASQLIEAFQG